jgi:hypothetical protein
VGDMEKGRNEESERGRNGEREIFLYSGFFDYIC